MSEQIVDLAYSSEDKLRLDKYLTTYDTEHSRSFFQNLIEEGRILVNGRVVKANFQLSNGDNIRICYPQAQDVDILPEDISLDILYEDSEVLIVNKPKGMVVHPAAGHTSGTLVNAIMHHCKGDLSGINGEIRPGIVHRIDKDTTGALIICKNDNAHNFIAEQISVHSVNRRYVGIVQGIIKEDEGTIRTQIARSKTDRKKMSVVKENGRDAITHYKVLERFKNATFVEFKLETGRTHQIRVHMSYIKHPLLGDHVYGSEKLAAGYQGQTLHAKIIGFIHPKTNEYLEVQAPIPEYFEKLLDKLRKTC